MMPLTNTNHKKNNVLHVRVSDEFLENMNKVLDIMKNKFGEDITASEAVRRLATYSFVLIFRGFTAKDILRVLSRMHVFTCEKCNYIVVSLNIKEICPVCGNEMDKKPLFTPTNDLLKLADNIPLTRIIEILES